MSYRGKSKYENYVGQELYGQKILALIKEDTVDTHNYLWVIKCECGKIRKIRPCRLIDGSRKKCRSCSKKGKTVKKSSNWKGGEYVSSSYINSIRGGCNKRGLEWAITIDDVENMYIQQNKKCVLSGMDIQFKTSETGIRNIEFGIASVDRKDSNKGYTKDNIQIVDKHINFSKRTLTDEKFIEMCKKVAKHNE